MPTTSGDKLCPICDSPLQPGSKKCSFCGTDLSIFDIDIGGPKKEAPAPQPSPKPTIDSRVDEIFSKPMPAPAPTPAPVPEAPRREPPKVEPPSQPAPRPEPEPVEVPEETPERAKEPEPEPAPVPAVKVEEKPRPAAPSPEFFECPECKAQVPIEATICPKCGVMFAEEGETFQCPACNALVNVDAKSCPGCGALFVEPEEAANAETAAAKPVEPQPEVVKEDLEPPIEEVKEEKAAPEKEEPKKLGGWFKWGKREEKEPKKEEKKPKPKPKEEKPAKPAKPAEAPSILKVGTPKPKAEVKIVRDLSQEQPHPKPTIVTTSPAPSAPAPQPTAVAPQPTAAAAPVSSDKGTILARMVAEMKPLFTLANEREVDVSESKGLIDDAVVAGRERQVDKAIDLVQQSKASLMSKVDGHLAQIITKLNDEIRVARDFGGDISRPTAYMQEVSKARGSGDIEAAYVYADKVKKELLPITGRYNESRTKITDLKKLIQNCEVLIVDTKEARAQLSEANKAFEMKDFDKVDATVKSACDGLFKAIPGRMTEELQKAKEDLIELKSKNVNITPMLTVLKSARGLMNSGDYAQAMKEMRDFKDLMKKAMG